MTGFIQQVTKLFMGSFDQTALIIGVSDIVVVKWDSGHYLSTPFVVCFGQNATTSSLHKVLVYINNQIINGPVFTLDQYGYVHPMRPNEELIKKLNLKYGQNIIKFQLGNSETVIEAQIFLYSEHDKLLVSDVDGTLTRNDIGGIWNNLCGSDYLHEGYSELIEKVGKNGYKIVWVTMRSAPLYIFTKNYIKKYTNQSGALLTEPQEMFPAMKNELLRKTGNIKTNMIKTLRNLFPEHVNPFAGGLGNLQNDAIAYRATGIPAEHIYIIDGSSKIQRMSESQKIYSYKQISEKINLYFKPLSSNSLSFQTSNEQKKNPNLKLQDKNSITGQLSLIKY